MAIVRWDPFAELNALQEQMNALVSGGFSAPQAMPATDVYADDKELTVEAHLPNFKEEEISVDLHEGVLEIKAEHSEREESKKRTYYLRESSNKFYRRIALPKHVDSDAIKAHFDDGVLKVVVPLREKPAPKKIAVTAKKK